MKANEGASALPTSIPEALETGNKWRKKRERGDYTWKNWCFYRPIKMLNTHWKAYITDHKHARSAEERISVW